MSASKTQEFRLFRFSLFITTFAAVVFLPLHRTIFPASSHTALLYIYIFCMVYPWFLFFWVDVKRLQIGAVLFIAIHLITDNMAVWLQPVQGKAPSFMLVYTFVVIFNILLVEWPNVLMMNALLLTLAGGVVFWPGSGFGQSAQNYGLNPTFAATVSMIYFTLLITLGTGIVEVKRRTERQLRFINENLNKIVEQKVAEIRVADREARRAQEQLEKILQHTPVGVVICDERLNCIYTNGVHFKLGIKGALPGEYSEHVLPFELLDEILQTAKAKIETIAEQPIIGARLDFIDKNQCERRLRYSYVPVLIRGEDGEEPFKRFILITEDITVEEVMRYKLVQADHLAAMGKMAAGLAHEINNPLSVIRIYIEALGKGVQDVTKREKVFVILKDNIQRIDRIIKSFLTFGRQEKPAKEWIDVQSVLRNTLELATNLKQYEQIEIKTEFATDVPAILGDQHRLSQVFVNLLNNARDAMLEKGGTLLIRYERLQDEILIQFKDTGKGIEGDDVKHIFTPFFTTKEPGKGTGLGLSISYGIIQEHGGSIDVESKQGIGTTFKIHLPIPSMLESK